MIKVFKASNIDFGIETILLNIWEQVVARILFCYNMEINFGYLNNFFRFYFLKQWN